MASLPPPPPDMPPLGEARPWSAREHAEHASLTLSTALRDTPGFHLAIVEAQAHATTAMALAMSDPVVTIDQQIERAAEPDWQAMPPVEPVSEGPMPCPRCGNQGTPSATEPGIAQCRACGNVWAA